MARTKNPEKKKPATEQNDNNDNANNITPDNQKKQSRKDSSASRRNEEKLSQDGSYVMLPDVNDIPGQENIVNAGVPEEMADTTISSDDEEGIRKGKDVFEEEDDTEIVMGTEADVTAEDLAMLGDPDQDMDMNEDELIRKEGLDDTDADGDPLNEGISNEDSTGEELDIPEADDDDPSSASKEQDDEENDYYSLGGGDKDALNEGKQNDQ